MYAALFLLLTVAPDDTDTLVLVELAKLRLQSSVVADPFAPVNAKRPHNIQPKAPAVAKPKLPFSGRATTARSAAGSSSRSAATVRMGGIITHALWGTPGSIRGC